MRAQVKWPSPDSAARPRFSGKVTITQDGPEHPAHYKVRLRGLNPNSLHGFHIHTNPITSLSDLEKTCATCGGHFNPTGQEHGSILNDDPTNRHVGDLINNLKADGNGEVCVDFYDELATLIPTEKKNYTVLGKSLVVHEGTDDLGRGGKTPILPYVYSNGKVRLGSGEDAVESYRDKKLLKGSRVTGNAGGRLACGNIQ